MSNAKVIEHLRRAEIFLGLVDSELIKVASLCRGLKVTAGTAVFKEGDSGNELYIILDGCVRVMINTRNADGSFTPSTINRLYPGQCFGEMILLNSAARSATVEAVEPTTLIVMHEQDFRQLCESDPRIGYVVIRNLAQDLAFKLRSSNLLLRGQIRWQHDELGKIHSSS